MVPPNEDNANRKSRYRFCPLLHGSSFYEGMIVDDACEFVGIHEKKLSNHRGVPTHGRGPVPS